MLLLLLLLLLLLFLVVVLCAPVCSKLFLEAVLLRSSSSCFATSLCTRNCKARTSALSWAISWQSWGEGGDMFEKLSGLLLKSKMLRRRSAQTSFFLLSKWEQSQLLLESSPLASELSLPFASSFESACLDKLPSSYLGCCCGGASLSGHRLCRERSWHSRRLPSFAPGWFP